MSLVGLAIFGIVSSLVPIGMFLVGFYVGRKVEQRSRLEPDEKKGVSFKEWTGEEIERRREKRTTIFDEAGLS